MATITFADRATEMRALAMMLGRSSGRVLETGEHLVSKAAMTALAEHNISFTVEGNSAMTSHSNHSHFEVTYAGRVQGVGFRYTARHIAERFAVTGYVENLHDGRVHLVVEGQADVVRHYLDAVQDELGRYIQSVHSTPREATGAFRDFRIRPS